VASSDVVERLAEIMGVKVEKTWPYRPVLHCAAKSGERKQRAPYAGIQTCTEAAVMGGPD
jgi:hypothetical protein